MNSFYCRAINLARQTEIFNFKDQFVANHHCHNIFLQKLHSSVRKGMKKLKTIKPHQILKRFNNWRDAVIDWFNDWAINGYSHKKSNFIYMVNRIPAKVLLLII